MGLITGILTFLLNVWQALRPKRQPDAEAQDQRATAVDQAARAETQLHDQQAAVAASGESNATVTKAADAAAAVQRDSVSNPASVDSNPAGHWRAD